MNKCENHSTILHIKIKDLRGRGNTGHISLGMGFDITNTSGTDGDDHNFLFSVLYFTKAICQLI